MKKIFKRNKKSATKRTTIMTIEVTVIDDGSTTKEQHVEAIRKAIKAVDIIDDVNVKRAKVF